MRDLAARCRRNGPIAQLGERLICIQEVIGSIPFGSTKVSCTLTLRSDIQEEAGAHDVVSFAYKMKKIHEHEQYDSIACHCKRMT